MKPTVCQWAEAELLAETARPVDTFNVFPDEAMQYVAEMRKRGRRAVMAKYRTWPTCKITQTPLEVSADLLTAHLYCKECAYEYSFWKHKNKKVR
jgi:hypothetical protein